MRRKHRRASQPAHTPPLAAVSALSLVLLGMFAVGTASAPSAAASSRLSYGEALAQGVGAMENGRHTQALAPLRLALLQDRNDPLSTLTLGILYLHTGSPVRAQKEFARARALAPGDALAVVGSALAALAQGRVEDADALLKSLPAETAPEFGTLRDYVRVLTGQSAAVRAETAGVTAEEGDALRLQVAAFAALRGGDPARGEALLKALLGRPAFRALVEERALLLPFETEIAAQGGAPGLPTAIEFPEPASAASGVAASGRVTLTPPGDVPTPSIGYVSYSINDGLYAATTNYAPYTSSWNSERVPNGLYTLRVTVYDRAQQQLRELTRTLKVFNANAPKTRDHLTEEKRDELRARLARLLIPRPSRKAAHFALAERAAARGDSEDALARIESVVAIDPNFHNARASLRQYHTQAAGPYEGIWKGETQEKIVALTFDDGPNPAAGRTPALLEALKAADAKATFFVVGLRAEENPGLLRQMVDGGHEVANHSYSHPNLTYLTTTALERELCRTSVVIREATGKRPRFYRPPGGNFNSAVVEAARTMGMAGAYWTVDAIKYESAAHTPQRLTKYVLDNATPGSIILLHNAPDNTVAAVGDIVRGLRAKGYTIVTMSELVRRARPVLKGAVAKQSKAFYSR
ncbi:MAG TPA: polysaccharide deacetylase family protein [Armatimonadaceae bacterium]|nr:polysaccharide deacetylase family protein [Armatimonadaceae bacterium]